MTSILTGVARRLVMPKPTKWQTIPRRHDPVPDPEEQQSIGAFASATLYDRTARGGATSRQRGDHKSSLSHSGSIPKRGSSQKVPIEEVKRLLIKGWKQARIAAKFGCNAGEYLTNRDQAGTRRQRQSETARRFGTAMASELDRSCWVT